MSVLGAILRVYSYLFHLILGLFFLAISVVTIISGQHNLKLGMLPWSGEELTYWLLGLSLLAIISVVLAVTHKVKVLLVLWSAAAVVLMVRGFFLSNFTFAGPGQAKSAAWLTLGAIGAFFGSLMQYRDKKSAYRF